MPSDNHHKSLSKPETLQIRTNFQPIVLLGFMGAGKTSVARALANKLACEWVDLDKYVERKARKSIPEIFKSLGERAFRQLEIVSLKEVMLNGTVHVIALGGGAWTIEENRKAVAENNFLSIWLDAPFKLCWQRVTNEDANRPLAVNETAARKLFDLRRGIYEQATFKIEIKPENSPENIADQIISLVTGR